MGAVRSLMEGFGAGYDLTGRVLRDSDLAKIAGAAPQAAGEGFSFLGKTYTTRPDDVAVERARQMAMAGVFDRYGETERASQIRQGVRRDEIADQGLAMNRQRFEWEQADRRAVEEQRRNQQTMQAELRAVYEASPIGQRAAAYSAELAQHQQREAGYQAALAAGDPTATPPPPPAPRVPSVGEAMLLNAQVLDVQLRHGAADPATMLRLAEMGQKLTEEGYGKALTMAQSGAPLTQVVEAFNSTGQARIDPQSIVADKTVDRGGVKSRLITFRRPDGQTQTIDTLAELDALGRADKIFTRAFAANADRRAEASLGLQQRADRRAQEQYDAGAPQRELANTLARLQTELVDPKTTPERRQEVQSLLAQGKGPDQNAPAQVKLAEAALQAGMFKDMREALTWANSTKDASPERIRADVYTQAIGAGYSPQRARAAADEAMRYLFPDQSPPTAAAAGRGSAIPPPEKRKIGGTYMTPKGAMTWRGNGWEPAR